MRGLLFVLVALLMYSCAQKVDRISPEKPVYYAPLKGYPSKLDRGFVIRSSCDKYVRAVESGRVVYSGKDISSYGWVVIVEQTDGFVSVYGRMSKPWVRTGEKVKRRQVVGKVGRLKSSCGVYYELRDHEGNPVRPVLR